MARDATDANISSAAGLAIRLRALFVTASVTLMITVFLLIAINLLSAWLVTAFPAAFETRAEKITRQFNNSFGERQGAYVMKWLALRTPAELQDFFVENTPHAAAGNVYEDFTYFKPAPWKGRFFNFPPGGYREVGNPGPWPPSSTYFNIFFFGGSTTMGIGPDWATIPSYLQEHLEGQKLNGKPIKVYNFGRGAYFSTQERILFQQLLLDRLVPDMAIFLDGLNDFFFLNGRPAGWEYNEQVFAEAIAAPSIRARVMLKVKALPMARVAEAVADKLFPTTQSDIPIYKPELIPQRDLESAIDRYLENKRQIEGISQAYGIVPLFVWQPVPGYRYDLRYHVALNPIYGLGGHERSSQGYPLMADRIQRTNLGDDFLWLGDMQEGRSEPLYMDAVHYTAGFCEDIATQIADFIVKNEGQRSR